VAYCSKENLPVDFISTHAYPTDYALDPESGRGRGAVRYVHSLRDDLSWLRSVIAQSDYPEAEIHITEWSTSPNSRDRMHDNLPPAAYIVKTMLDCRGLAESVMYWTFTDIFEEKGGGPTPFHGGFGMMTFQGWKKPSYHAFRMLHALGDEQLYYMGDINHCMEASSKTIDFCIENLPPHAIFTIETLDDTHGNALHAFQCIGSPDAPTREQSEWMKEQAETVVKEKVQTDANGTLRIRRTLRPWTLMLFRQDRH